MTPAMSFVPLVGRCPCNHVRFRMERPPIITHCCHCRSCQRFSGSAFRINAMIEADQLSLLAGTPEPVQSTESQKALRCPVCRSALWSHLAELGEAIALVGIGTLDHGTRLSPEAHYFTRFKHPWVTLPSDVPCFDELGDPQKPEARARIEAALRAGPPGPLRRCDSNA